MSDRATFASITGESSLDHLRILTIIGESAGAVVYLAEWVTPLGGLAAIKRERSASDRGSPESGDIARLLDLDHPRIATLFDVGVDQSGRWYSVSDYVAGVPLVRFCETYELSLADRLELVLQLAEALEYAHARGVRHLNLKESNVLVVPSSGIMLLDFLAALPGQPPAARNDLTAVGELLSEVLADIVPGRDEDRQLVENLRALARTAAMSTTDERLGEFCRDVARVVPKLTL